MELREGLGFDLKPNERRCFYELLSDIDLNRNVEIFADGSNGANLALTVYGPIDKNDLLKNKINAPIVLQGEIDVNSQLKSDTQMHSSKITFKTPGFYAFCLDNTHSRLFANHVQLDIVTPNKKPKSPLPISLSLEQHNLNEDSSLQSARESLQQIEEGIYLIQRQQLRDRRRLILHINSSKNNYSDVFYGSLLETLVFIFVSMFQIYFVRRWFSSKVNKQKSHL